jgi:hypothetical protein
VNPVTESARLPSEIEAFGGETVLHWWRAGRTQSSYRLVGGKLYLTNFRLIFAPNQIEVLLAAGYWNAGINTIVALGRQEKDLSQLLGGSIRDRLWIKFRNRSVERFRVKNIDLVAETIRLAHPKIP